MMRKLLLSFMLCICGLAQAQLIRWAVPPVYENVHACDDGLFVADSAGYSVIWANDSIRGSYTFFRTTSHVNPFQEKRAVLTRAGSKTITGYMMPGEGRPREIRRGTVANDYPYFSQGYLVVMDVDRCVFYSKDNQKAFTNITAASAKPFFNGVSACLTYDNIEKKKNPRYFYLTLGGDILLLSEAAGKSFGKSDIQYVSSIGGDNFGIVVAKNKVYKYMKADGKLHPFLADESNAASQVTIAGNISKALSTSPDGSVTLAAKGNTGEAVSISINAWGIPVQASINGRTVQYKSIESQQSESAPSPLTITGSEGSYGIALDGEEVLPNQLQDVGQPVGFYVPAKMNGRWGVLFVDEDYDMMLSVNGGGDLYFDKSQIKTSILLVLPVNFPVNATTDFTVDSKQVKVNKESRTDGNTLRGNYVEYECTITSPGKSKQVTYPVTVTYDGLRSRIINVTASVTTAKPKPVSKPSSNVGSAADKSTTKSGTEIKIEKKKKKKRTIEI